MTSVEIVNPVPVEELVPWLRCMLITFLEDTADIEEHAPGRAVAWDASRAWGVRADHRWVATLRTIPRTLTIPGTNDELPADALTNVSVAATHRRRGLLTTMLGQSLEAAKQRGDAVSILIAAEWPIYGRFGYAPAVDGSHYTLSTRTPGSTIASKAAGAVRQVEAAELGTVAPAVFAAARMLRAGNIDRPQDWWDRQLGLHGIGRSTKRQVTHIVHEGEQGVDGYLSWSPTGEWDLAGNLGQVTIGELVSTNASAYLGLCHYLLGIDIVDRVHLRDRPVDEPLQWLLADGRAIQQTHRGDRVWLRLLDVESALSRRRYGIDGQVVIEVVDRDGAGYAAGRYLLEGGPEGAECIRTDRVAELRLSQRALAAAYLGGFSLTGQRAAGGVEELRGGALRRADAMFATPMAPWCATGF